MGFLDDMRDIRRPDVQRQPWMDECSMQLVTPSMLESVVDECIAAGVYGFDLETSSLDNRIIDGKVRGRIVGVCLSPAPNRGFYIPMRHQEGAKHNVSTTLVYPAITRLAESEAVAVFHNAKFDQEFLYVEGLGDWDNIKRFDDTMILAWLRNTRELSLGLKHLSQTLLGRRMIELRELFGPEHQGGLDFSLLDPSWQPCVWYACSDAINTLLVRNKILPEVMSPADGSPGQQQVYNIERLCVPATRWMERNRIYIRQDKVAELLKLGQQEFYECLKEIYGFCENALERKVTPAWVRRFFDTFDNNDPSNDVNKQIEDCRTLARDADERDKDGLYVREKKRVELTVAGRDEVFETFPKYYDVLSRMQLGELLCELQIPDLSRTGASGQIKTTQAEIDQLDAMHGKKFPFLPKIKRLGELQKAIGTYLIALARDVAQDGTLKVSYFQCGTDTGRFTTPKSRATTEDGGTSFPLHGTPATYDKKRPQCLLRIREVIGTRKPNATLVTIDYGGVELRIGTFLSGEPQWLREYFRCSTCGAEFDRGDGTGTPEPPPEYCPSCGDDRIGDIHTLTAITFYGEDAVNGPLWKQQRNDGKRVNFSLVFGGGPAAIMRVTGCDEMLAAQRHRAFNVQYSTLAGWWERTKAFARKHGYVVTDFGRRYPIPDILLPTDTAGVREFLLEPENRARFSHRIYLQLRRSLRLKRGPTAFEKYTYDAALSPMRAAAEQALRDYQAEALDGKQPTLSKPELVAKIAKLVEAAEVATVKEQVARNRKYKSKGERNATNGPIQGLSADITKIAMGLIYRECKKRKWLDKARMIITIHDELVFEIDDDILAEAIEVFQNLMARNPVILKRGWTVPLTTDCELGEDWTVPYNIRDLKHRRVRSDGVELDRHGSPSGKVWPARLLKLLGSKYGFADMPVALPALTVAHPTDAAQAASTSPTMVVPAVVHEHGFTTPTALMPPTGAVATKGGGKYEYNVKALTVGSAVQLASVIVRCRDRGTSHLCVRGPGGEDLLWPGAQVLVNPIEFELLANQFGV